MIKLDKRHIISICVIFFYLIGTVYPQPSTLAPPSSFEKTRILVVCTGNTCRSPLASVLLKKYLPEAALQQVKITSAGIFANPEDPASNGSIEEAEKEGIDLNNHTATPLTLSMIQSADIILVMTKEHLDIVKRTAPDKTFLFAVDTEIPDPMLGEISYSSVAQIMKDNMPKLKLLLSEKLPNLRKGLDPERELWGEAVRLSASSYTDKKRAIELLSRAWENPFRVNQAIKILVNALNWEGALKELAKEVLVKIGSPAVLEIINVLERESGKSLYVYTLLEVLGEIKDPISIDSIVGLFLRPDYPHREVERTLYKIGDPRITEKVLDLVINSGRRDPHIMDSLRWLGRLNIRKMLQTWQDSEPEIKTILFNIILQMSSEISLGPLLISIRGAEGDKKAGLEKKRDKNWNWEKIPDDSLRKQLAELAYFLYEIKRLDIFHDLITLLTETKYAGLSNIIELITKARETSSLDPFLLALGKLKYKKNTNLLAILLDKLEYYPSGYISTVLGQDTANFLEDIGTTKGISYQELVSSSLFWFTRRPKELFKVKERLKKVKVHLGIDLFNWAVKEFGLHTLTNNLLLEEAIEINLDPRLAILVHPCVISHLREKIPGINIGRRLFFLSSYTKLAQSGKSQNDFKKILNWNFKARKALVEPAEIDITALEKMIAATDMMFFYYTGLFSDDDLLPRIESKWVEICKTARELVGKHGSLQTNSPIAQRITQLGKTWDIDSIETIHGFINFIHQRGLDKRFNLKKTMEGGGIPGNITTALFSSDGKILDRSNHSFIVGKKISGISIYTLPEELRHILRNLLFFMNDNYHLTECRLDISGTEITIILPIGEHSARLYINLSQPQQGGMIELQWDEGNMESGNILRQDMMKDILTGMGFSVVTDSTLLKARYDSQIGARTIKDIMDTGGRVLRLITGTRDMDFLLNQSTVPYYDIKNDLNIIWLYGMPTFRKILEEGNAEPYRQLFVQWEGIIREALNKYLKGLAMEEMPEHIPFGINMINTYFNKQIDRALERQELVYDSEGQLIRNTNYEEPSQVHAFAELLQDLDRRNDLIIMANLLHEVVKIVPGRLVNIGGINGYVVRRLELEFPGKTICLWGLYNPTGQILAAYGALGDQLNRLKDPVTGNTKDNIITSPQEMLYLLKDQRLMLSKKLIELSMLDLRMRTLRLDRSLASPQFIPLVNLGASVRFAGVKVSGGLATGRAIFNSSARLPEDFGDAILVAPYTSPGDEPKMEASEGIVTTGGGPLTHTGIIARELRKPSLIISGDWNIIDGETLLKVPYEIFTRIQERVGKHTIVRRINIIPRIAAIKEGDILTIDGNSGILYNWGQSPSIQEAWELCKVIQVKKDWKAWNRLLELAKDTQDRLVARFLIHKIFAGKIGTILDLDEKTEFVSTLCSNTTLGEEGKEFLSKLVDSLTDELYALIREYKVRIVNSFYPREISHLLNEIQERRINLEQFYNIFETGMPDQLLKNINELKILANLRYKWLGEKIVAKFEIFSKKELPKNTRQMRHLKNLWKEAELLSKFTTLDLKRFSQLRKKLNKWEMDQQRLAEDLKDKDILTLNKIDFYTSPLTGAKASTLGEIAKILRKKFIPNGFSLTNHAFQMFMESNNLWPKIEKIMASPNIPERKYELVQEVFSEAKWPEDLEREVLEQYHKLEKDLTPEEKEEYIKELIDNALQGESEDVRSMINGLFTKDKEQKPKQWGRMSIGEIIGQTELVTPGIKEKLLRYNEEKSGPMVAVRSSAIGSEDSPEASFAGEMDTYLYQRGKDVVLYHIKRCMASLWTPRVISYREWYGYPQTGLHHSVFIQLMVDSEASAVGFTIDPTTDDWNQIVLNTGWGIGEGIMGRGINTDFYSIDKSLPLEEGVVTAIRPKPNMYVFNRAKGSGISQADVPANKVNIAVFNMKDIEIIQWLFMTLEKYWGIPRDIELAKDKGGNIKLVQDRPVTALNGIPKIHRKLTGEILTFSNTIKRFDEIRNKIVEDKTQELTKQELHIIALVLLQELKPARIKENRQLEEKANEAIGLVIRLRNNPELLTGLIIESVKIAQETIKDIKLLEVKSLIPYLISQLVLYSDSEGLKDLSIDQLRKYLTLLLNDPYLKGYLNLISLLEREPLLHDQKYKIYLSIDLFYKKIDGRILPFNVGLKEALQRLSNLKNNKGERLVEIEFISHHSPGETHELMQTILGEQADNFKVNYNIQIPDQEKKVLFVLSQTDPTHEQLKDSGMVLLIPHPGDGEFISGRGILVTALAWLECGGKVDRIPDNLKELQQFLISGPKPIPLTKEYEELLSREAAMNRSV